MMSYRQGRKPLHEYLRSHARATPDKTAIVWYGRRISYAELDAQSDRFARALQESGIGRGDVIVLVLHNCPQYHIAHLGAHKLGVIVCPCEPMSKAEELGHQVRQLDAAAVVVGDELLDVVRASGALRTVRRVFAVDYGAMLPRVLAVDVPGEVRLRGDAPPPRPAFAVDFEHALAAAGPLRPCAMIDIADAALVACTFRTPGLPRGAMLSYESALEETAACADAFGLSEADVLLADTPLHHLCGTLAGIALPLYTGATVVLLLRFDPLAVLQATEACQVSWWSAPAASLQAVMRCDGAASFCLSSLRRTVATSFGAPQARQLARRWADFAGGCRVVEAAPGLGEAHAWGAAPWDCASPR